MRNVTLYIIISCLFLSAHTFSAIQNDFNFTQIGTDQGMPSHVGSVYEASNGLIWLGTSEGLMRYDGRKLKSYTLETDDETLPVQRRILQVIEDQSHQLWVLTNNELALYSPQTDSFQPCLMDGNPIKVNVACEVEDGIVFGGTDWLYKYMYKSGKFVKESLGTLDFSIRRMKMWDKHTLICSDLNHILFYDLSKQQANFISSSHTNRISDLCIDTEGYLWIADYNEGIKKISEKGEIVAHYATHNSKLSSNLVLCITIIKGKIWAGTDGGGINIIDPESGEIQILEHESGNIHTLPANTILCIYGNEKKENVWVGTTRRGLLNIRKTNIRTFTSVPQGCDKGLSEKTVLALYQEQGSETIWIGTDGGGMNKLDTRNHLFKHFPNTWGDKIVSICNYSPQKLLISVFSKGFYLFDKENGRKEPFNLERFQLNNYIRYSGFPTNLYNETENTILLLANPVSRYYIREKRLEEIMPDEATSIIGMLCPISNDDKQSYFYDTQNIYKIEHGKNKLQAIFHNDQPGFINSVYQDKQGVFWIASSKGLFSLEDGRLEFINSSLFHKAQSVLCDSKGRVWIGAGQELFSYHPKEKRFMLYGEADGVLKNEYLSKPILLSNEGNMYIGGVNGLLYIQSDIKEQFLSKDEQLDIEIIELSVNDKNCIDQLSDNKIVLPGNSRNIRMSFLVSGDDILRPRLFQYNLDDGNQNAIISYENELNIPSLATGTYPIYVHYTQKDGKWSAPQRVLTLVILPPWYKSWWFTITMLLLFCILIYLVFLYILRKRDNQLKWMFKEHEQKIYEEKVRFLININHELRTPLTLIYAPLKKAIDSIEPNTPHYRRLMTAFKQSQRMKDLVNMVLDVRKMEVGMSKLNASNHHLNQWIQEVCGDFINEGGDENTIQFELDNRIDEVNYDKEKCFAILSNLLTNAIKHNPKHEAITIRTSYSEDQKYVRISVSDKGPGLKGVNTDKLFTRFYQGDNEQSGSGIGLSYAKILVELHKGNIGAYNNPEGGATFYFELPLFLQQSPREDEVQPSYLNDLLSSLSDDGIHIPEKDEQNNIQLQNYTLLLVDDNVELIDYMTEELKGRFKQILTANDGKSAYRTACDKNPDIVVSDIMMPGMNGYELCKAIKEDFSISHIPVILLTARNDDTSKQYGYMLGADSYLEKPFEIEQLVEKIQSKLYNRMQVQKHYHQIGIHPVPVEDDLTKADHLFMEKLNKVINEHLDNPQLDIPLLCEQVGTSRASLYNKLKAITGMGANDYINKIRIEQAMRLIRESNLNFTEISEKVGFASPRYFSTSFKQYTGKTPTQYKKE